MQSCASAQKNPHSGSSHLHVIKAQPSLQESMQSLRYPAERGNESSGSNHFWNNPINSAYLISFVESSLLYPCSENWTFQRSRFLVLTKSSAASGDENGVDAEIYVETANILTNDVIFSTFKPYRLTQRSRKIHFKSSQWAWNGLF